MGCIITKKMYVVTDCVVIGVAKMDENELFTFLTEVMNFPQEDMEELKSEHFNFIDNRKEIFQLIYFLSSSLSPSPLPFPPVMVIVSP